MHTTPHLQRKDSNGSDASSPPFLPLEEANRTPVKHVPGTGTGTTAGSSLSPQKQQQQQQSPQPFKISGKKIVSFVMCSFIALLIWDAFFVSPEKRMLKPDFADTFLIWVQGNPRRGALGLLLAIAIAVVLMIPIGTPLTLGCGYIYKGAYGWRVGLTIATIVSMAGSALGAVICFLLGRYLMRDQVRTWIKKYPIFVAIDVAAAEHGLRIMAMLYLTPILPLGPVSYMCGTTSMALSSFVTAKIASLPLMLLYAFIGASAGALIKSKSSSKDGPAKDEMKEIEGNRFLIVSGILMSFVMIACITHNIKKELNKILDRQEKHKPGETKQKDDDVEANEEAAIEMGATQTAPRQRLRVV